MTNLTCPICQASQEAHNAWLKDDKVIILLMCINGHWQNIEVPSSRFINVTGHRNPASPPAQDHTGMDNRRAEKIGD